MPPSRKQLQGTGNEILKRELKQEQVVLKADPLRTICEDHYAHDIGHYIRRARQERELAARAAGLAASHAHLARAKHYDALTRACSLDLGHSPAADLEVSNFVMTSQKLWPFHDGRTLRLASVLR